MLINVLTFFALCYFSSELFRLFVIFGHIWSSCSLSFKMIDITKCLILFYTVLFQSFIW